MQYRPFGRTGWQVSEIAFGGWQIGGDWGAVDDDESIRTLLHAYERGAARRSLWRPRPSRCPGRTRPTPTR